MLSNHYCVINRCSELEQHPVMIKHKPINHISSTISIKRHHCTLYKMHFKNWIPLFLNSELDREREGQKDLPPAGSLPSWPQWPGPGQAEARSLGLYSGLHVSHFSLLFRVQQRGTRLEMKQPGLEPSIHMSYSTSPWKCSFACTLPIFSTSSLITEHKWRSGQLNTHGALPAWKHFL